MDVQSKRRGYRLPLFTWSAWSFAACGFLTAVGQILGLNELDLPIFPAVKNLPGLVSTSLLLTALGLVPLIFQPPVPRKGS